MLHSHNEKAKLEAKKSDMAAVRKMLGLYVFGPPLTNAKDPALQMAFRSPKKDKKEIGHQDKQVDHISNASDKDSQNGDKLNQKKKVKQQKPADNKLEPPE